MTAFLIRRLMQAGLVVAVMSVIVFFGVNVVGNPVDILVSPEADQAERARVIREFGLDQPVWQQYLLFLKGVAQGSLGRSFVHGESALKLILERMPATVELALAALIMAIVIGIPLGLYAGVRPAGRISKAIMAGSILGFSLPTFWVGLMLIMVFAVNLGWLPSTGRGATTCLLGAIPVSFTSVDGLKHLAMPATNLALFNVALLIRLTRAGAQ